jgi:hypothetical protein
MKMKQPLWGRLAACGPVAHRSTAPRAAFSEEWIGNGAVLGWLIDPDRKAVEIYRSGCLPEIRTEFEEIEGEGPVNGFILDLRPVWTPITSKPALPEQRPE